MQFPADQHDTATSVPEIGSTSLVVHDEADPPDHEASVPENAVARHDDAELHDTAVITSPAATLVPVLQFPLSSR